MEKRLAECKLSINREKTKVVYCGLSKTYDAYDHRSFDFLGYTFQRRLIRAKTGKRFVGFVPAISNSAKRSICQVIKRWRIHHQTTETIGNLAKRINPYLCGWINYYGKFYRSAMEGTLRQVEYY